MCWVQKRLEDGEGLQDLPGPCRSCRSGWQWWLQKRRLTEYEVCPYPSPSLLLVSPGSPKEDRQDSLEAYKGPFMADSPSRKHHLEDSWWHIGDLAPAPSGSC